VWCSVLQRVAACCSLLQPVAVYVNVMRAVGGDGGAMQLIVVCFVLHDRLLRLRPYVVCWVMSILAV